MAGAPTLTLFYHPLSSFCMKALMALYENDTPFTPQFVDFQKSQSRDAFLKVWPIGQFPVLRDDARDWIVPEFSIIIEYLDQHYPGPVRFIPEDPDAARQMRMRDRFFDLHVQVRMQKIVIDNTRPKGQNDPFGVADARDRLKVALDMIEGNQNGKNFVVGDALTMADCAAAPALFYADKIIPLAEAHPKSLAYLNSMLERPSFARVIEEAEPYIRQFPGPA